MTQPEAQLGWGKGSGHPQQHSSRSGKMRILNKLNLFSVLKKFWIIETKWNSLNNGDLFKVYNFCWGQPLSLLVPQKPICDIGYNLLHNYATITDHGNCSTLNNNNIKYVLLLRTLKNYVCHNNIYMYMAKCNELKYLHLNWMCFVIII
jgi:hypothetical protein